jgi:hypothetical protein
VELRFELKDNKVKAPRVCQWCFYEWWEWVTPQELIAVARGDKEEECPNCHLET